MGEKRRTEGRGGGKEKVERSRIEGSAGEEARGRAAEKGEPKRKKTKGIFVKRPSRHCVNNFGSERREYIPNRAKA